MYVRFEADVHAHGDGDGGVRAVMDDVRGHSIGDEWASTRKSERSGSWLTCWAAAEGEARRDATLSADTASGLLGFGGVGEVREYVPLDACHHKLVVREGHKLYTPTAQYFRAEGPSSNDVVDTWIKDVNGHHISDVLLRPWQTSQSTLSLELRKPFLPRYRHQCQTAATSNFTTPMMNL